MPSLNKHHGQTGQLEQRRAANYLGLLCSKISVTGSIKFGWWLCDLAASFSYWSKPALARCGGTECWEGSTAAATAGHRISEDGTGCAAHTPHSAWTATLTKHRGDLLSHFVCPFSSFAVPRLQDPLPPDPQGGARLLRRAQVSVQGQAPQRGHVLSLLLLIGQCSQNVCG